MPFPSHCLGKLLYGRGDILKVREFSTPVLASQRPGSKSQISHSTALSFCLSDVMKTSIYLKNLIPPKQALQDKYKLLHMTESQRNLVK